MTERGVFALDRGIFSHPMFADEAFTEREAWAWMISEAAWKPRVRRMGSIVVSLERGQLAASIRFLAERWGWKKGKIERFLNRLKTGTMIGTDNGTGVTVITICNYDKYQRVSLPTGTANETENGTEPGQHRDSIGTKEKTLNTLNTLKTEEVDRGALTRSQSKSRGSRLPDGWQPSSEAWAFSVAHLGGFTAATAELEKFWDHWRARAGPNALKVDWNAAWRNWCRKALELKGNGGVNGKPGKRGSAITDAIDRRIEQLSDYQGGASGDRPYGEDPARLLSHGRRQ